MEVYSIVNLKGGVGKTVTACNLAAILGEFHEKQVLLIDADAQANASAFFDASSKGLTLTDVLQGRYRHWKECIQPTNCKNVSILSSDIGLLEQDIASIRAAGKPGLKFLGDLIWTFDHENAFDIVIFDCPPAFSAASVAAIACSDAVIIPTKIDAWSVSGVEEITRQVEGIQRQIRPNIRLAGVLVTMYHTAEVQRQGITLLRQKRLPVYDTVIRRTDKVDEATFARQPLFQWSRNSAAGRDYIAWVKEFVEKERRCYRG